MRGEDGRAGTSERSIEETLGWRRGEEKRTTEGERETLEMARRQAMRVASRRRGEIPEGSGEGAGADRSPAGSPEPAATRALSLSLSLSLFFFFFFFNLFFDWGRKREGRETAALRREEEEEEEELLSGMPSPVRTGTSRIGRPTNSPKHGRDGSISSSSFSVCSKVKMATGLSPSGSVRTFYPPLP